MKTVVVVGATGTVGAPLVTILQSRGYRVVRIARSLGVDLRTGSGLQRALRADTIVDVSNIVTTRRHAAVEFFSEAAARLLRIAEQGGI